MKAQIVTAVLLSVVLVGGATWFRFMPSQSSLAQLVVVANSNQANELSAEEFFNTPPTTEGAPARELSRTDVVGRELFSDYMSLKINGQATPENLSGLVEKYASDFNLDNGGNVKKVTKTQLTIVPDSNQAILDYNRKILDLRTKYEAQIKGSGTQTDFSDILDPAFSEFMLLVSTTYEQAAAELIKFAVPTSLSDNHLSLINNYLTSVGMTRTIATIGENPIDALAALNTQAENSQEEEKLIANIKIFLISKGLYSSSL